MQLKYITGALLVAPLLPLMYYQGKKIRASVPSLPEAKGIEGIAGADSTRPLKILFIGESTIAGVGVSTHEEGFAGTLAKELAEKLQAQIKWKVYARSGYTALKVKEKLIPKMMESSADLIVIGLGGNDAFTLNSPKRWRNHIIQLIEAIRLKLPDTPIAFTNMPPIKEFPAFTSLIKFSIGNLVELLGHELESVSKHKANVFYYARKITLADWIERLNIRANKPDFFSDGVHPSLITYQTWARDFADYIFNTIKIKKGTPLI